MKKKDSIILKIWDSMSNPRFKIPLLITAMCLTLILAALLLSPYLPGASSRVPQKAEIIVEAEPEMPQTPEPSALPVAVSTQEPIPEQTPEPSPEPSPEPTQQALVRLRLTGNSVNRDLYVRILDENGVPVTGHTFRVDFLFPDGLTYSYDSEEDGSSYYLVRLEPGEYVVSLQPLEGFVQPEPIRCTVKAEAQYEPIADIETVAEVKDVTEVPQEEVPDETSNAPEETVPEVIVLPDPETLEDEVPVTDEDGRESVVYRFPVGPNGYLLYRGTDKETNVIPVDEDGDGSPEYGLYLVEPEEPGADGSEQPDDPGEDGSIIVIEDPTEEEPEDPADVQPYYVSVELYNADGTPVDTYEYEVVPQVEVIEKLVGWQVIDGVECFIYEDGSRAVGLKKIDGKLYYFNQFGVKASSVGIDVSFYNEDINWQAVKAQGIDFAIIRIGGRGWKTGVLYGDTRTQEYLRGARAAGIKVGVYFYSTAVNPFEAVEEASVAISTIGGIGLDYPIFIDLEYSGDYPDGRADQLTASQRTEIAIAFCETIRSSGYRAGVYSGQNFFKSAINYGALSGYTIWLASYTRDNQLPNFSNRYDIWQFTDRGLIDGIDGEVDMNVIF